MRTIESMMSLKFGINTYEYESGFCLKLPQKPGGSSLPTTADRQAIRPDAAEGPRDGRLVNLDHADAGCFEIRDFVPHGRVRFAGRFPIVVDRHERTTTAGS